MIFNQAGKVRKLQLEETLLKKYLIDDLLTDYRNNLRQKRLKEQIDFFEIWNKSFDDQLKKKYAKLLLFVKKTKRKKVNAYIAQKTKKIKKLLRKETLKTAQVQLLRKQLKNFNYNQKIINSVQPNKKDMKINILPDLLGKWHDCQVIIQHLEKAMITLEINPMETLELNKIKATFVSKRKLLFDKIETTIAKYTFISKQSGTSPKHTAL